MISSAASVESSKILIKWKINTKSYVIPNWAPINQIPYYEYKDFDWINKNNLGNKFIIMYSGTMGMKHNPKVITYAAQALQDTNIHFVIISEGTGFDYLKKNQSDNITLLPLQPFKKLPKILSCSDLLLTILEKDAGIYSVPSKVWSYFCSKRPSIFVVPENNLVSKIGKKYNTSIVVKDDIELVNKIKEIKNDDKLLSDLAINSRKYAENFFNIDKISNNFLNIIKDI